MTEPAPLNQKIKEYSELLFDELPSKFDLMILMTIDRTKAYLNRDDIPIVLASVIAEIIYDRFTMLKKSKDTQINSISDNGQSVSFNTNPVSAFSFSSDLELFGNHSSILNNYRKVKTIRNATGSNIDDNS